MRIICKRPSERDSSKFGLCAYDIVSFRHHPLDTDPLLVANTADGRMLMIKQPGRNNGTLDRIVEILLSPSGVADCRNVQGLSFDVKTYPTHVLIDNSWAQTVLTDCGRDGDLNCLAVAPIR